MADCNEPAHVWNARLTSEEVRTVSLELLFQACRAFYQKGEDKLAEKLIGVLADRAARSLRARVGRNHANEGTDIIVDTVAKVIDAVLDTKSLDAVNFGAAFQVTLGRRLTDQIRKSQSRAGRETGMEIDEDGGDVLPPDFSQATPEQALIIQELLSEVDPRKRRALALSMAGYPASTGKPGALSIASMLKVSPRTAESWLREMRCLVQKRMKE